MGGRGSSDVPVEKGRFLIVDDEDFILNLLELALRKRGHFVYIFSDPLEALSFFESNINIDVAILDYYMPSMDGLELLRKIKRKYRDTEVIIMTGRASIELAIEAMKEGAFHFFEKPFERIEAVVLTAEKALERKKLRDYSRQLEERLELLEHYEGIVGVSPKMKHIFTMVEQVANYDVPVLILGETGTGKERLARTIHHKSSRRDKPFVPIDCSVFPETLIESALFGYRKGSFTGAVSDRIGLIEAADGGTLFLDEVGDIPLPIQVKLLRFLQEGEFQRLGDIRPTSVDVRVISATNKDLTEEIRQGRFREDLYYRLNVIELQLPPLRERREDIPALAYFFLKKYAKKYKKNIDKISVEALDLLKGYDWPGNVRELEHVITRAIILENTDTIGPNSLPENLLKGEEGGVEEGHYLSNYYNLPFREAKKRLLETFEHNYLQRVLESADYNISRAARLAQMDRSNFRKLLKKYKLI